MMLSSLIVKDQVWFDITGGIFNQPKNVDATKYIVKEEKHERDMNKLHQFRIIGSSLKEPSLKAFAI